MLPVLVNRDGRYGVVPPKAQQNIVGRVGLECRVMDLVSDSLMSNFTCSVCNLMGCVYCSDLPFGYSFSHKDGIFSTLDGSLFCSYHLFGVIVRVFTLIVRS